VRGGMGCVMRPLVTLAAQALMGATLGTSATVACRWHHRSTARECVLLMQCLGSKPCVFVCQWLIAQVGQSPLPAQAQTTCTGDVLGMVCAHAHPPLHSGFPSTAKTDLKQSLHLDLVRPFELHAPRPQRVGNDELCSIAGWDHQRSQKLDYVSIEVCFSGTQCCHWIPWRQRFILLKDRPYLLMCCARQSCMKGSRFVRCSSWRVRPRAV
jgi:hypothetical protein